MSDPIDRQKAVAYALKAWDNHVNADDAMEDLIGYLEKMPTLEPGVIRCKDCFWWEKYRDENLGYCKAAKHDFYSESWGIQIRRICGPDFYCADGERKGEQE